MKTKRKQTNAFDSKLYNAFDEVFNDKERREAAIKDAKKAFSFVQQDILFKSMSDEE